MIKKAQVMKSVAQQSSFDLFLNPTVSSKGHFDLKPKVKYPPFASTWMELEGIMLSEVSQSEKDKHYLFSFIWGI